MKFITFIIILLFLFLSTNNPAGAQIKPFVQFTEDDGLPGNTVRDVIKDKDGIIWVGTDNGLAKYDGEQFINIIDSRGLALHMVFALASDENDVIYANLFNEGLAIIKNDSVKKIVNIPSKPSAKFRKLYYSNYFHQLFVGTNIGLYVLKDSTLLPITNYKNGRLSEIHSISSRDLLIYFTRIDSLSGTLYKLNVDTQHIENSSIAIVSGNDNYVCLLAGDTLYSGSFSRIWKYSLNNQYSRSLIPMADSNLFIWSMALYKNGRFWIGGLGDKRFKGDIILYDPKGIDPPFYPFKSNTQSVNSIFYDSISDITWFARDDGLTLFSDSPFSYCETENSEIILDIGMAGDSLMTLTNKGICYFDGNRLVPILTNKQIIDKINYHFQRLYSVKINRAHTFDNNSFVDPVSFVQNDRTLFVTTQRGCISVPDMKFYVPFAVGMFKLFNGISAYSQTNYEPLRYFPSANKPSRWTIPDGPGGKTAQISEMIESNGVLYCLSPYNGLYAIKNGRIFLISSMKYPIDNNLLSIDKDPSGNLWCLSANGNLFEPMFLDSLYIERKVDLTKIGIIGNNFKWLKFNGEYLLIGTNKGLNVIKFEALFSDNPSVYRFYNNSNGYDFVSAGSPVLDGKGKVYLYSKNKIIAIDTNFCTHKPQKILLSDLQIDGKIEPLCQIEEKSLSYGNKQISFTFKAIKYPTSKNIRYRYKVGTSGWVQGNKISLQSLRPGRYQITMEGYDQENSTTISKVLDFIINPPVWMSFWFIFTVIFVITLSVYLIFRWRIFRLKKQHDEKTRLVQENSELRLRSLQLQMNPHFIFNALVSVQRFIVSKSVDEALMYISILSDVIRTNLENALEEYIFLSSELEFINKYVEIEKLRFKEKLKVEIVNNLKSADLLIPPMLIQPVIENAIKHGIRNRNEGGLIKVSFTEEDKKIKVTIVDNGVGRAFTKNLAKKDSNGKGLKIIEKRLTLLNEMNKTHIFNVKIKDLQDNGTPLGTKVELSFMLKRLVL